MKRIFLFLLLATVARGATYDYPVKTATNALSPSKVMVIDANGKAAASTKTSNELLGMAAATNGTFSGGTFTGGTNTGGYYTNSVFYGGTNNATTLAGTTTTGVGFSGNGYFSGSGSFNTVSPVSGSLFEVLNTANSAKAITVAKDANNYFYLANKVSNYDTAYLGLNYSTTGGLILQNTYSAATVTLLSLFSPARAIDTTYNAYFLQKGAYSGLGGVSNAFQIYAGASLAALEFTAAGAAAPIVFMTGGTTERMRLSSAGNLGIGTTTPQYLLDLSGQVRILGTNGVRFGGTPNATDDTVTVWQPSANVARITASSRTEVTGPMMIGSTGSPAGHVEVLGANNSTSLLVMGTPGTASVDTLQIKQGGSLKFSVTKDSSLAQPGTITTPGTTGAQTINKPLGTVNLAAGATSLVVTDSVCLSATNCIVFGQVLSNDTTCKSVAIVVGTGSFTIYPNAAPTAETVVAFQVIKTQ